MGRSDYVTRLLLRSPPLDSHSLPLRIGKAYPFGFDYDFCTHLSYTPRGYIMHPKSERKGTCEMDFEKRKRVTTRIKRIAGQVAGVQRMIDEDRYCVDVLNQIAAVRSALDALGVELISAHLEFDHS